MSRDAEPRSGISFKTLAIASAASATATVLVPMLWRPGTLPAAALTPIVVALVTEFLNRPKLPITKVKPLRGRPARPAGAEPADRFGLRAADRRRRLARIGIVTGLIAFAVVAVIWTVGELAAGESLSGGERTTYFGGEAREPEPTPTPADDESEPPAPTQEETPVEPQATPTPDTATPTPAPSETPEAETPTPTPGAAPGATPAPGTAP